MKSKPYDFFDYTKDTFDIDFAGFGKQIEDLEYSLKVLIDTSFEDMQVRRVELGYTCLLACNFFDLNIACAHAYATMLSRHLYNRKCACACIAYMQNERGNKGMPTGYTSCWRGELVCYIP
jgi:hypothetical protein